jgi:hypothetical protein
MRKVTAPDGTEWKLGRRWIGKRARLGRAKMRDAGDLASGFDMGADDLGIIGAIVFAVVAIVVLVFAVLLLFNVVAIAIELAIILIVLIGGIVGRVAFRRPWTIFGKTEGREWEQRVVGWRASGRALDEAAQRIASGAELETSPRDRR